MTSIIGDSSQDATPAISGKHSLAGRAVEGISLNGPGVHGESTGFVGIWGKSQSLEGIVGETFSPTTAGIAGFSRNPSGTGAAVFGFADSKGAGVVGISKVDHGVFGESKSGVGVFGKSQSLEGIVGETFSPTTAGIAGFSRNPSGTGAAIFGLAESNGAGIVAITRGTGPAIIGKAEGNAAAAVFQQGDVVIERGNLRVLTGDIILQSADCAEEFDISSSRITEPGTVMVITSSGELAPCEEAYDKRVAGVISGAGTYKPAMILDRQPEATTQRMPVALVGKVFCKVDAQFGAIEVGDLLTTSSTPGHAMKVKDITCATGAIIGKALSCHYDGTDIIPILVCLQ
jgi:hypothetical protein